MDRSQCADWNLKRSFSVVEKPKESKEEEKKKTEALLNLKREMHAFVRRIDADNEDVSVLSEEQRLELYQILGKKNIPKRKKKSVVKKKQTPAAD